MSKKFSHKENFRVVIDPRSLGDFGGFRTSVSFIYGHHEAGQARARREEEERADEIAADVRRHVDNVGHVGVECDEISVCEHCGAEWTETSTTYNGGCCDADQEAQEQREAGSAT